MKENVNISLVKNGSAYEVCVEGMDGNLHEHASVTDVQKAYAFLGSVIDKMNLSILDMRISAHSEAYQRALDAITEVRSTSTGCLKGLTEDEPVETESDEPAADAEVPSKEPVKASPMMKQFQDLKAKHPDALLLFRCGDFYETYQSDAEACADILGITLTRRNGEFDTCMAGFPYHALDTYLPKLIRAGRRVAICDQLTTPTGRVSKQRKITELIKPAEQSEDLFKTAESEVA